MVCNKCGAVCDDQATVCPTCGEPFARSFDVVQNTASAKNKQTNQLGMILGIISILLSFVSFALSFFCLSWITIIVGVILGIASILLSKSKIIGIAGIVLNVVLGTIVPIVYFVVTTLAALLMSNGIVASENFYY